MRILIIANERTGSTTLMKGLSNLFNIPFVREPFLPKELDSANYNFDENSIIVKTLIGQQNTNESHFIFLKKIISKFDYIILLGRKNVNERYESLLTAQKTKLWHLKYSKKNYEFNDLEKYFFKNYTIVTNELLLLFGKEINKEIIWYEDLFSNFHNSVDTLKKTGLPITDNEFEKIYKNYLSPLHKYLQPNTIL